MLIKRKRGWELPESAVTPEHIYLNRRNLMKAAGGGLLTAAGAGLIAPGFAAAQQDWGTVRGASEGDPTADLYPVTRNPAYTVDRPVTDAEFATTYNNFYEFGSHKEIWRAAQDLEIRPWTVRFDGMVEEEREIDIDQLIRAMPLEERIYRLRCVEAWSMVVPWSGFQMSHLIDYARPLSSARYVRMETFLDPDMASGQQQAWYPWPYVEGLTMDEAMNELAFMVTGMYGQPVTRQNGAPLRIHAPWKYGFKSLKSIVRITFTDERPLTFWEEVASNEYGFWANVNPEVPHRRWSQARERDIATDEMIPTQLYNGYAEFVEGLYENRQDEALFM
ncbi:protein-methionine-sulfoxide reductase catalytic subunit MsrP [Fodinicurvata sp. EGI_FJ10296]|uniref:protein-methionine-sulfoxide reductase catalytic subunit MsrP n=1 Tax=Fodinicurvata sp. EGI_FJ10296 TaxID=3231908 RepID=UPI0034513364